VEQVQHIARHPGGGNHIGEGSIRRDRDVLRALSQRRNTKGDDIQPEVEVAPEDAAFYLGGQVAIRRRQHAEVRPPNVIGADRPELLLLQDTQKLGLHVEGQLTDLVEECRPAVCHLDQTHLGVRCARGTRPSCVRRVRFP
jgi:hypothetical protein